MKLPLVDVANMQQPVRSWPAIQDKFAAMGFRVPEVLVIRRKGSP